MYEGALPVEAKHMDVQRYATFIPVIMNNSILSAIDEHARTHIHMVALDVSVILTGHDTHIPEDLELQ